MFSSIASADDFKTFVLEWLYEGLHNDDGDEDAFFEALFDESERWLSFEDWEAFCMAHGLA
jgi:hypothetical protein